MTAPWSVEIPIALSATVRRPPVTVNARRGSMVVTAVNVTQMDRKHARNNSAPSHVSPYVSTNTTVIPENNGLHTSANGVALKRKSGAALGGTTVLQATHGRMPNVPGAVNTTASDVVVQKAVQPGSTVAIRVRVTKVNLRTVQKNIVSVKNGPGVRTYLALL